MAFLVLGATFSLSAQSLLRIQMIEGEGLVNAAGTRSQRPIAVQLTDETGRPLEGIAVSFRLPEEGPGGSFESGMKTEVVITTADGRAAIHGIRWNQIPGPFQIRVTAAKGESRAGTICSQYISAAPSGKASVSLSGRSKKKWLTMAAIAAGGATVVGVAALRASPQAQQATQAPAVAQPVQIGLPTLSITRP